MLTCDIITYIKQSGILEKKNPLIVILGPTGSGKTAVSIDVAKEFNGEIISADSAQIYKQMDIGTAKITPEEMQGVPHHMIDIIEPDQRYSAAAFKQESEKLIKKIYKNKHLPMLVGGTMLWIDAVVYNFQFPDRSDVEEAAVELSLEPTLEQLQTELKELDPKTYETIDSNNPRRLLRAITYVKATGQSFTAQQTKDESNYNYLLIGLRRPREVLYERLNQRVHDQLAAGLLAEVTHLASIYSPAAPGMQCISYRQLAWHIQGEISREEAIKKLQQTNRNYAKRQMTWWRRNKDIKWFDCN